MKRTIKQIPLIGQIARKVYKCFQPKPVPFDNSERYWQERYAKGDDSGDGSYGRLAAFKASVLNDFVKDHSVESVIEFGCGDGNQLALAKYPKYLGIDISDDAIERCRAKFKADPTKQFKTVTSGNFENGDLLLSLDVVYHLVEDDVFEKYMRSIFDLANRFVIVYSSNTNDNPDWLPSHVRHRQFTDWVVENRPDWTLLKKIENILPKMDESAHEGSIADFYVFGRKVIDSNESKHV